MVGEDRLAWGEALRFCSVTENCQQMVGGVMSPALPQLVLVSRSVRDCRILPCQAHTGLVRGGFCLASVSKGVPKEFPKVFRTVKREVLSRFCLALAPEGFAERKKKRHRGTRGAGKKH